MYKLILIIFFPIILLGQNPEAARYYADYAQDSIGVKDLRLYTEYLTKAIELDSLNPDYFELRSYAWQNLGNQIKAIEDFDKAISIYENDNQFKDIFDIDGNPIVFEIYKDKFYYLSSIGNLDDAIEAIDWAIYNLAFIIQSSRNVGRPKSDRDPYIDELMRLFDDKSYVLLKAGKFKEYKKFLEQVIPETGLVNMKEYPEYLESRMSKLNDFDERSDFKRFGDPYYPYTFFSNIDSIKYPIDVKLEFNLESINLSKIDENEFYTDFTAYAYTHMPREFIRRTVDFDRRPNKKDTINIAEIEKYLSIQNADGISKFNFVNRDNKTNYFVYEKPNDKKFRFNHIWDLSDFPFDKQELKIKFQLSYDSSIVRLKKMQKFGIKNHFDNVTGLPKGQVVDDVNFYVEYLNTGETAIFTPTETRNIVNPVGVFEIVVSRSGSLLFVKLFLGTFLAFIMSLSAFTIRKRNFGTRIDVSVGALFIAVGNKYFVESVTPLAQVLTKADIINNLSLLLIILNVVFIIAQHRSDFKFGKFENSYFTLKFSSALLAILVFITILA